MKLPFNKDFEQKMNEFVAEKEKAYLTFDIDKIKEFISFYAKDDLPSDEAIMGGVMIDIVGFKTATEEEKERAYKWLVDNKCVLQSPRKGEITLYPITVNTDEVYDETASHIDNFKMSGGYKVSKMTGFVSVHPDPIGRYVMFLFDSEQNRDNNWAEVKQIYPSASKAVKKIYVGKHYMGVANGTVN